MTAANARRARLARPGPLAASMWLAAVALVDAPALAEPAASRHGASRADDSARRSDPAPAPRQLERAAGAADRPRDDREADARLAEGLDHYERREFERAIGAFAAGYRASPRPEFLFALAQAERRSGDCTSALVYYRAFLDTGPTARQVAAARMHIRGCRAALASGPQIAIDTRGAVDIGGPAGRPAPDVAAGERARPSGSPGHRGRLVVGLVAGSVAAGAAGAGLLYASRTAAADAESARSWSDYQRALASASRYRALAAGSLVVGSTLAAGALWAYLSRGTGDVARAHAPVTAAPAPGGLTLAIGGRF